MRALVARIPPALVIVIGLGVILRVLVWIAVSPTETNLLDAGVYVGMADDGLFTDPVRPAGYSMFLRAAHAISAEIGWTMFLQNAIGIATACVLYAAVRRIGGPLWAAIVGAAAILLSLDQIYLEHIFLSDCLFTFLLVTTLYLAVRALDEPRPVWRAADSRHLWLLGAGACLGLAAWVRGVAAPLTPFLALWVVFAIPGPWLQRIGRAAIVAAASAALVLTYFALDDHATGTFGLTRVSGRVLYGRVAPFADCSQFDPPAGTSVLCEQTPPDQRPGPDFYSWDARSVAVQRFGLDPSDDAKLGKFARTAALAQPGDYAEAVAKDFLRNFIPGYNDERPYGGTGYEFVRVDFPDVNAADTYSRITDYYDPEPYVIRGLAGTVGDVQAHLHVSQLMMLIATVLAGAGIWLAPDRRTRAGIALLLGVSLLAIFIPPLTINYGARYAIPIGGPIIAAGALGLWVVLRRRAQTRS
ncbi:MAG: ArnT family glycosyltransferase [Solirubrobacterales bacterium]